MTQLKGELAELEAERKASAASASKAAEASRAAGDSMDSYMEEMKEKERQVRDAQHCKRIGEIQEEMGKTERLIKIATPALALDAALPLKKPGAAQLSAFTFKQFAGAGKKISSGGATAASTAAAKALADKVFAHPAAVGGMEEGGEGGEGGVEGGGADGKIGAEHVPEGGAGVHAASEAAEAPADRKPLVGAGGGKSHGPRKDGAPCEEPRAGAAVSGGGGGGAGGGKAGESGGSGQSDAGDDSIGRKRERGAGDGEEGSGKARGGGEAAHVALGVPQFADFEQGGL